ncbi:hypothetical protein ACE01N_02550 [Saccharicrinis sp. FJH2]|uniref:hypothetical protein n=1 Tax=Saccharicrinis sp. FJH65 TaxID=3344659 RepID=UPI0035F2C919
MSNSENNKTINLLWTGGWDSTFRLCQLLLINRQKVQPYYLIDEGRLSLRNELLAQKQIKAELFKKFPFTKKLILPTKFFTISDLKSDPFITKKYTELKQKVGFGIQYNWLAIFCRDHNLYDLELSFEKAENGKKGDFLRPHMESLIVNNYPTFRIKKTAMDSALNHLFIYYLWPLWETSRDDMIFESKRYNFLDILNLSWFCHSPIKNKACGVCNPCKDVVEYGMNYRLSKRAMFRYHMRHFSVKNLKQKLTSKEKNETIRI